MYITREEIYKCLERESSLLSRTYIDDNGIKRYEHIFINEQDYTMLKGLFDESVQILCETLNWFVKESSTDDTKAVIVFDSDPSLDIQDNMKNFIVSHIKARWVSTIMPDKKSYYEESKMTALKEIGGRMFFRKPPTL